MTSITGSANITASIPLTDYLWFLEECQRRGLSRSATVAALIAEARQRQSGPDLRHTAAASDPINGDGHSSI